MYIIIVGGGKVGYHLSKALLNENHEVLVIEKDATKCDRIADELGSICMRGDGCETSTLIEAGTQRADIFIAATDEDEDNLVACQIAKYKFNVPRTIARLNNPENESIFKKLGIDRTVSVVNLLLEHIEEEIPTYPLIHLLEVKGKGLEIVEMKIPEDSKALNKPVNKLSLPPSSILLLLIPEEQKPRLITPDTVLKSGDRIIALTTSEDEAALRTVLTES